MNSGRETGRRSVFLNVPFDRPYEPLFVALVCALVALGRVPRSVLEVPEDGKGRLSRLLTIIRASSVSIHDLSRGAPPARFNMPFELGIAFALSRMEERHKFIILEAKRYRLQKTLNDANGIDPGIHNATVRGVISCVLSDLGKPRRNPSLETVALIHRQLWKTIPFLKRSQGRKDIYSRSAFGELVAGANALARKEGLIAA
jgi:hypothetical protein